LTPVTISIVLNGFQLDAGFLIQTERYKKALKRIQKKMMRAMSTLDWSQSNNISCFLLSLSLLLLLQKLAFKKSFSENISTSGEAR